jgi:hypothetical protein
MCLFEKADEPPDPERMKIAKCPKKRRTIMEEYFTTEQLSKRIHMSPGTIRNLVWMGVFQLNVHYVKPRGKLLFIWSAVREWLHGGSVPGPDGSCNPGDSEKCLIQI